MPDFQLTTPVAFIIFNRTDTTERVFAEIAKARPPKLLVVGDGPRPNRSGEAKKVATTRAIIKRVGWDCEVLTNFSEVNLGCKQRVSSGIDWVFDQVPEAIILEDDCLPDPTFFQFCQEMLERYRHDQRIGMISGDNFQFGRRRNDDSYYFSKYVHVWGWATWRDRWIGSYDVTMSKWPRIRDEGGLADMVGDTREAAYWQKIFDRVHNGEIDTWDYQWVLANWIEGRMNVLPEVNLISNVGFDENATHTHGASIYADMKVEPMDFPLRHPEIVLPHREADSYTSQGMFNSSLSHRVLQKLRTFIR